MNLDNLAQFENELYLGLKKLKVNNASSCLKYIVRLLKTFKNQNDLENIFKEKLEFLLEKKTDEVIDIICNFFDIKRTYGLPLKRSPQKALVVGKEKAVIDLEHSNDARLKLDRACQQRLEQSKKLLEMRRRDPEHSASTALAHSRSRDLSRLKWNDIAGSLRSTNTSRKLNIPCSTFLESGICMNGDTCKFTHGKAALVKPKVVKLNSIYNTPSGHVDPSCYILPNQDDRPNDRYGASRRLCGGPACHEETINISSGDSRSSSPGSTYMRYSPPKVYEPPAILDSPLWYKELGLVVEETASSSCYSSDDYSRSRSRSYSPPRCRTYRRSPGGRQYPLRASSPSGSSYSSGSYSKHRQRHRHPSSSRRGSGPHRHRMRRRNCLLVTNIPADMNRIGLVNKHFRKYGTLRNVQVRFKGDPGRALVEFRLNRDARLANTSLDAVMGNRFIKTRLYKKKKKREKRSSERHSHSVKREVQRVVRVKVKCASSPRRRSPSVALIEPDRKPPVRLGRGDDAGSDCKPQRVMTSRVKQPARIVSKTTSRVAKEMSRHHKSSRAGSLESGECRSFSRVSSVRSSPYKNVSSASEHETRQRSRSNASRTAIKLVSGRCARRRQERQVRGHSDSPEEVAAPVRARARPSDGGRDPLKQEKRTVLLSRAPAAAPLPMDIDDDAAAAVAGAADAPEEDGVDVKLERALHDSDVDSSDDANSDAREADTTDSSAAGTDRVARAQQQRKVVVKQRRDRLRKEHVSSQKNSMKSKLARVTESMDHYKAVLEALILEFKAADKPRKAVLVPQIKENHARFMQLKKLRLQMLETHREKALAKGSAVEGAISELHTFISEQLRVTGQPRNPQQRPDQKQQQPPPQPAPVPAPVPAPPSAAADLARRTLVLHVPTNVVLYDEQIQSMIGSELPMESFGMVACSEVEVRYAVVMSCESSATQALRMVLRDKPIEWRVTLARDDATVIH